MKKIYLILVLFLAGLLAYGNMSNLPAKPFNNSNGLVAYYPFNGNANDESGNGHHGSVSGATSTADRFNQPNKAYNFVYNGFSSDKIQVDGTSGLNFASGGFSLSAWVKFSGLANAGYNYPIFSKHICGEQSGFILMLYNGKLTFWLAGSSGYNVLGTSDDYTDNSWHQVVAVYDGADQLIYVDGVLKNHAPFIYNSFNSANWALGGYNGCNGGFNGKVDEIQIYDQALTGAQIQEMYNNSLNELVAYYPFNGNADDASGNGNNGSLMNGALFENDRDNNPNQSVRFDKSLSQYVDVANSPSLQIDNTISFSFWLKRNSLGGQDQILNKGGDWPYGTCNYGLVFSDWTLCFIYNGGYYYVDSPGVPQDNDWHHYAVTALNGTTEIHFYVDGVEKAARFGEGNAVINLFAQSTSNLYISGVNYYSNNTLDELKIYNKILSATEINSIYTNMVAYYPFNGNANDESGNGNHGTITGAQVTPAADRYSEEGKAFKFWFPDYVSVPTNSSFFTDEFTVSYWYKVEAYWGDRCVLSCVGRNGGYQQPFSGTTFQYLFGYNFPTNSWFWTSYTVPNPPNTWQHITTTYKKTGENASISKLYINGELKSSDTYTNSIAYPGSEIFYIGRNHSDLGLNGELDDVRFYNKTLSDQGVKSLYLAEAKPVLQQPANQSSVNSPTPELRWISPQAEAEFIFQLAADPLFGTILYEQQTSAFSIQLPASLINGEQNFYWRVCSKSNEVNGPWSAVWSFNFVNTGLATQKNLLPFLQIYPNPANTSAKLTMCFPENIIKKGTVTLEFINSIGKCVKKTTFNNIKPGIQQVEIETISLLSGIYYVKTDFGLSTQKLVIQH